jgi:hypothetical protein
MVHRAMMRDCSSEPRIQMVHRLLSFGDESIRPCLDYQNIPSITHASLKKGRLVMITVNKHLAAPISALALGLALAALASPSFAQRSEQPMSTAREQAIRECNGAAAKYHNSTWQGMEIHTYRSCMAQHGEPE